MLAPSKGLSLIELLVTLGIIAILSAIIAPSFTHTYQKAQSRQNLTTLFNLLKSARLLAIEQASVTSLCPSSDGLYCSNNWNDGLLLFKDFNENGLREKGEDMVRFEQMNLVEHSLKFTGTQNKISYAATGFIHGTFGSFLFCPVQKTSSSTSSNRTQTVPIKKISVSLTGRIQNKEMTKKELALSMKICTDHEA